MGRKRGGRRRSSKAAASSVTPPPAVAATAVVSQENNTTSLVLPSKSLYLFCSHFSGSSFSYTLYKINLQDDVIVTTATTSTHPPLQLSPVLELPGYDVYPTGMKCALLDSKLYILGGEIRFDYEIQPEPQHHYEIFPPHVYQFDITTNAFTKMDAPLNTGKPGPCVFAAAGMIYALGTKSCPNLTRGLAPDNISTLVSPLKLFECFDPKTNQWQVLDNPPVDEFIRWTECNVLGHRHKVVISGWDLEQSTLVVLVYDLHQQKWRRYVDPRSSAKLRMALSFQEADSSDHLYGLLSYRRPVKSNMDITWDFSVRSQGDHGNDVGFVDLSLPDKSSRNIRICNPYVHCETSLLRYLGDSNFCYMAHGMIPHPDGPYSDGFVPYEPCCWGTTITLFKEISDDHGHDDNIDGNSTSTKSGGEKLGNSFQAKILHRQKYVMKFPSYNVGELTECFVVSHEPKVAAPVKEDSPTAKPQPPRVPE